MSEFAKSFAMLVKNNNGMFKSEKQAQFLLSVCQEENVFFSGLSVYGNSVMMAYECDSQGVKRVVKMLRAKADVVTWTRKDAAAFCAVQVAKEEQAQAYAKLEKILTLKNSALLNTSEICNKWIKHISTDQAMFMAIVTKRDALSKKLEIMAVEAMRASDVATDKYLAAKK